MGEQDRTSTVEAIASESYADPSARYGGRLYAPERWLLRQMLRALGDPPIGLVAWTGEEVSPAGTNPEFRVHIRDRWALWGLVLNPELYFGDALSAGRLEVEGDLVRFLETQYRASATRSGTSIYHSKLWQWINRPGENSVVAARDNIYHHYDIGNSFYALWLDREMQYTCAYFPTPTASLEEAQLAKLEHVARKLHLRPGETVVEAGCGWGGLARYLARHHGVSVKAYNISREQVAYARERARAEGLDDRVEYIEDDYRHVTGQFDAFVSVGMLEHAGQRYYPALGEVLDRCLKPWGRGLIHTIGRNRARPLNAWIERRIFPGAYPPTLQELTAILEPWSFSVLDVENLRLHYARTLEHWLRRFDAHRDEIKAMFDENFLRSWRLYLAGSEAGFTTGELQLFQVLFARPTQNDVPWTRAHLYAVDYQPLGLDAGEYDARR
jgi:cyclopropane-fatty-acyl-phospholipid synthase